MNTELIAMIANISLALSLIVAIIFGISQVRAAARDRREALTLEALRAFASRDFAELLQYVNTHDMPKSGAESRALPVRDQVMFIHMAQQMEDLGILVAEKMIDVDVVDKTLGNFVVTAWEKFKPFAVNSRAEENDPTFNEYFQWLAETLDARMRANPRRAYYEENPPPATR